MIMKKPEADVIRFSGSDVVAASDGARTISLDNLGDGNVANGIAKYQGVTYVIDSKSNVNSFINALNKGCGATADTKISYTSDYYNSISFILNKEVDSGISYSDWNGTYEYDAINDRFTYKH